MKSAPKKQVADLWLSPVYREVVGFIEGLRPITPKWNISNNNVEEMKFRSAQLQMFDTILSILKSNRTGESDE